MSEKHCQLSDLGPIKIAYRSEKEEEEEKKKKKKKIPGIGRYYNCCDTS